MPDFVSQGNPLRASWANSIVQAVRINRRPVQKRTNIYINNTDCKIFAETIEIDSVHYLYGGIVYAGDKNYVVPDIDLTDFIDTNGEYIIYFQIPVTANTDDDGEVLLPGIETSDWDPSGELLIIDVATGLPDNTTPVLPSGDGVVIVPLGFLTVTDYTTEEFTFNKLGCGNISVQHCAGTLSFTRV